MSRRQALLRQLPAIDRLLATPLLESLAREIPHVLLVEAAQCTVAELRQELLREDGPAPDLTLDAVASRAERLARTLARPNLRPVLNLTGTLLHTNLGRAPLADAALAAVASIARGYSNLEFNLEDGERGRRNDHVEGLLCRLSGAEAALAVNNNAGAVLLVLTALAAGKEAIVSRGELVEIGGSFRVPEVMAAGGVILREVGTTNKTHRRDYAAAIGEQTGLLLKVHTSNFRVLGFTAAVSGADLAVLGREHGVPVMEDLGSGLLLDPAPFGLPGEPTVREAVAAGIDIVTFSGDKLLGGPQAGLIVGKKAVLERIRNHPLARAVRIEKLTLAALEATLRLYLDPQRALAEVPVLRMLATPATALKRRCSSLRRRLRNALPEDLAVAVVPTTATVGGGALPLAELPGHALAVAAAGVSAEVLAARLRRGETPVLGRIRDQRLLLDPRTLAPADEPRLIAALVQALRQDRPVP
jgi:L-seryl-tRNA(Ser) seleniumtransferase